MSVPDALTSIICLASTGYTAVHGFTRSRLEGRAGVPEEALYDIGLPKLMVVERLSPAGIRADPAMLVL